MGRKIGIDLGTTYSCVSYIDDNGLVRIADNEESEQTTPSIVYFPSTNEPVVVGSLARQAGVTEPERIVERVKSNMGDPNFSVSFDGEKYSATAVSTAILRKLVNDAKTKINEEIDGVVITCPAYFGDPERAATREAAEALGLNVLKILDEPIAASLAYAHSLNTDIDKTVLIYDLGGGTFDCTVLKLKFAGEEKSMEQITTDGDHHLGGKDWDARLAEFVIGQFCQSTGISPEAMENDAESRVWFSENVEKAKKTLTIKSSTVLGVSFGGERERIEITRDMFDILTLSELNRTLMLVDRMLEEKGLTANDIDEIIMVGGSTKMPQIAKALEVYGKPISSYEPDKAVAMGAALMADSIKDEEPGAADGADGVDGAIADGAEGVDGAIVDGADGATAEPEVIKVKGIEVTERLSKSLGLAAVVDKEDVVGNILLKNMVKPARAEREFGTNEKNQAFINLRVYENNSLDENVSVDESRQMYESAEIKLPEGLKVNSPIKVVFEVDGDGVLTVTVIDMVNNVEIPFTPKRKGHEQASAGTKEMLHRLGEPERPKPVKKKSTKAKSGKPADKAAKPARPADKAGSADKAARPADKTGSADRAARPADKTAKPATSSARPARPEKAAEKDDKDKAEKKPVERAARPAREVKKPEDKKADEKVEKKAEDKAVEKKADEKVAEKKADDKPAEKTADDKGAEKKAERKPPVRTRADKGDNKPEEKTEATGADDKKPEVKPRERVRPTPREKSDKK